MTERELLQLKKDVEEAKEKVLQYQGQKEALMQQLKDDFGCSTIKQAYTKLEKLNEEFKALDAEIEEGLAEIEKQL